MIPLEWAGRARAGGDAVDAERRRLRQQAVSKTPTPPPRLGAGLRRFSRLLLPPDDESANSGDAG